MASLIFLSFLPSFFLPSFLSVFLWTSLHRRRAMHTFSPLSHSNSQQELFCFLFFFIHILTSCVFLASSQYFCPFFSLYLSLFPFIPHFCHFTKILCCHDTGSCLYLLGFKSIAHLILSGLKTEILACTASIFPFMLCCL